MQGNAKEQHENIWDTNYIDGYTNTHGYYVIIWWSDFPATAEIGF